MDVLFPRNQMIIMCKPKVKVASQQNKRAVMQDHLGTCREMLTPSAGQIDALTTEDCMTETNSWIEECIFNTRESLLQRWVKLLFCQCFFCYVPEKQVEQCIAICTIDY